MHIQYTSIRSIRDSTLYVQQRAALQDILLSMLVNVRTDYEYRFPLQQRAAMQDILLSMLVNVRTDYEHHFPLQQTWTVTLAPVPMALAFCSHSPPHPSSVAVIWGRHLAFSGILHCTGDFSAGHTLVNCNNVFIRAPPLSAT
jgi:hypothetical protein